MNTRILNGWFDKTIELDVRKRDTAMSYALMKACASKLISQGFSPGLRRIKIEENYRASKSKQQDGGRKKLVRGASAPLVVVPFGPSQPAIPSVGNGKQASEKDSGSSFASQLPRGSRFPTVGEWLKPAAIDPFDDSGNTSFRPTCEVRCG